MDKTVIEIEVRAVLPTSGGCAVFLGNDEKVFVVYVDQAVGAAITMFMHHTPKPRPQTHDLFADLLTVLGAKIDRVVIVSFSDSVYYARIIITVSNELEEKKIIESYIGALKDQKVYDEDPITTEVVKFTKFYDAEDYHQDYEKKHPKNSYITNVSIPRLNRFKKNFGDFLKDDAH